MENSAGQVVPLLLSIREAAIALGVCERTVWSLAKEQSLPYVRVGRRVLFSRATLEAWIARQESTG
jgi:excisionase family DNA binding protein